MTTRVSGRHDRVAEACISWWANLNGVDAETEEEDRKRAQPHRAALAQLRRVGTIEGHDGPEIDLASAVAAGEPAYRPFPDLRRRLHRLLSNELAAAHIRSFADSERFDAAVAVVAATLARVRENRKGEVALMLGAHRADDTPLMAEARFKRLIRTTSTPDLLGQGRRIVILLGRSVPVGDLGASFLLWNADSYARRRWSFAYYGAGDMSPDGTDDDAPAPNATV